MKTQETSPLTHYEDAFMFGNTRQPIESRVYGRDVKPGLTIETASRYALYALLTAFVIVVLWGILL